MPTLQLPWHETIESADDNCKFISRSRQNLTMSVSMIWDKNVLGWDTLLCVPAVAYLFCLYLPIEYMIGKREIAWPKWIVWWNIKRDCKSQNVFGRTIVKQNAKHHLIIWRILILGRSLHTKNAKVAPNSSLLSGGSSVFWLLLRHFIWHSCTKV